MIKVSKKEEAGFSSEGNMSKRKARFSIWNIVTGSWSRDTKGTLVVLSRNYMARAGERSYQCAIWIGLIKIGLNIPRTQLWLLLTNRVWIIVRAKMDRRSLGG